MYAVAGDDLCTNSIVDRIKSDKSIQIRELLDVWLALGKTLPGIIESKETFNNRYGHMETRVVRRTFMDIARKARNLEAMSYLNCLRVQF